MGRIVNLIPPAKNIVIIICPILTFLKIPVPVVSRYFNGNFLIQTHNLYGKSRKPCVLDRIDKILAIQRMIHSLFVSIQH